jgi:hypothetical protein
LTVPGYALQSIRRSRQSDDSEFLLDFFDPENLSAGYQPAETCSPDGDTLTCAGGDAAFNLLAQLHYVFELVRHDLTTVPSPVPTSSAAAGGVAVISVPTPSPIVCSPSSDIVGINQTNYIDCTEQGYGGSFSVTVSDPSIASVQPANSLTSTFFSVTGLHAGSTTLTFQSQSGPIVSVLVTVSQ